MAKTKHSRARHGAANDQMAMLDEASQHLASASAQLQLLSGFFEALSPEDLEHCQPPGLQRLTIWEVIDSIQIQVSAADDLLTRQVVAHD